MNMFRYYCRPCPPLNRSTSSSLTIRKLTAVPLPGQCLQMARRIRLSRFFLEPATDDTQTACAEFSGDELSLLWLLPFALALHFQVLIVMASCLA